MKYLKAMVLFLTGALALAAPVSAAAQQAPVPYGTLVTLDQAKSIVASAERIAIARNITMAFAVVEPTGELILFNKMDGTQNGSETVARD